MYGGYPTHLCCMPPLYADPLKGLVIRLAEKEPEIEREKRCVRGQSSRTVDPGLACASIDVHGISSA